VKQVLEGLLLADEVDLSLGHHRVFEVVLCLRKGLLLVVHGVDPF